MAKPLIKDGKQEMPDRRTFIQIAAIMPLLAGCRTHFNEEAQKESVVMNSDFDFFMGNWKVKHRRLTSRLTGSDDWQEFEGECRAWKVLGGQGNIDDNVIDIPSGQYRAVTLRSYDPGTGQWAIWWLDARNPHTLEVPVKGIFKDGTGTFYADDALAGKPIKVRFLWLNTRTASPRWEQAMSNDGGANWETNWVMDFSRADPA